MDFGVAVKTCLAQKYLVFAGRAPRSEFWYFMLFILIVEFALGLFSGASPTFFGILYAVFGLGTLLPALAVSVRRLHDIDKNGAWILIYLIPVIGTIVLIVFGCMRGTPGPNRYGPPPVEDLI